MLFGSRRRNAVADAPAEDVRAPVAHAGYEQPARQQPSGAREPLEGRGVRRGEPVEGRRARRGRARSAGAAALGTFAAAVLAIARLVMTVAVLIALLIALAVVLRDVDANASNSVVKGIHEGANFFAGAFTGLITIKGHAKQELTLDWGIAVIAYLLAGALVSRMIAGLAPREARVERGGTAAASY